MKKFKKFDLDNPAELHDYEDLLNDVTKTVLKENFTWDRTKGNKALVAVWWEEPQV